MKNEKKKIQQEEHISKLTKISGFFTKTSGLPTNVLPEYMNKFVHSDKNSTTDLISNDAHTENKTGGLLSFNTETYKSTDEYEIIESTTPPVFTEHLNNCFPSDEKSTKEFDTTEFTEKNDDCELDLSERFPTDRGMFKNCISDKLKREILKYGPCKPEIDFPLNDSKRKFSKIYYYVKLKNGTLIPRPWLCYFVIWDMVYCETCWIFSGKNNCNLKKEWVEGINDWQHLSQKINIHESSLSHLNAIKVRTMWTKNLTINKEFETQISKEVKFWRDILTRIVKIILTLTAGNTALRGNEEKQYSEGNFLRTVKLVAEFDPILKSDITKVDQVSIIIRYVIIDHEKHVLQVKESFIGFYKIDQHGAQEYENLIYKVLSDTNLDIKKCKGQGYDGASVMKGMYSGVQKRIIDKAPNATYVHCCAHNLNLVICDAAKSSSDALRFFETIQSKFNFFSSSAPRWALLAFGNETNDIRKKTLKKLCPTRWEARHKSLFALKERFVDVLKSLSMILLTSHKSEEKIENILRSTQCVSKMLQSQKMNIQSACTFLDQAYQRFEGLYEVASTFSFLNPSSLKENNEADIIKASYDFAVKYDIDISSDFTRQVLSFKSIINQIELPNILSMIGDQHFGLGKTKHFYGRTNY
ncbi:uncharacterized protein LOC112596156 [Melanaphis sacchari]|uniref:uncharacterized protein LOC112596156 n=1 Tax=Melanaphis sacchari TaxID=742174 RepID=UPI000DC1496F|nr:uncharacterized protein LOC112596156 [Melanaphis sacchari]